MATQDDAQVAPPPGKKMRIAVLTSGGDSAGMNAAVRAVVKQAIIRSVFTRRVSADPSKWTYILSHIVDARLSSCGKATRGSYAEIRTQWMRVSMPFRRPTTRETASLPTFALVTVLCCVTEKPIVKTRRDV